MDIHKSGSLSLAAVLATSLITFSSFAQAPVTATSLVGNADPVYPWAFGVRVPLVPAKPPTLPLPPAPSQWTRTAHNPPVNVGTALLLTDGTVIAHEESDLTGNVATNRWYKLTPDINGSYINGTWTQIASMASDYGPLFFASSGTARRSRRCGGWRIQPIWFRFYQQGSHLRSGGQYLDHRESPHWLGLYW